MYINKITPSDFLEFLKNRHSVRAYSNTPVEKEKINRIIEAGRLAPSACNGQPWRFIVIDDPDLKDQIADTTSNRIVGINHFTKQAPVHIVIVIERTNFTSNIGRLLKKKPFPLFDVGFAASQMCLQAQAEGLGTCIIGWFNEDKVKKILNIPSRKRLAFIVTVGYPNEKEKKEKKRKTVEEIMSVNKY